MRALVALAAVSIAALLALSLAKHETPAHVDRPGPESRDRPAVLDAIAVRGEFVWVRLEE